MTKKVISNKFIIFCVSVQLFVHILLGIHVSITYWIHLYELGTEEPAPHERMKVSPKVFDLPECPRKWTM